MLITYQGNYIHVLLKALWIAGSAGNTTQMEKLNKCMIYIKTK